MKSKAGITLLVALALAVIAVAAAAAHTDGTGRAAATAAPATVASPAASKCGKTMYIGVAAPITGAASSIGVQQLHWAQFAVAQWNKSPAKPKFKIVQADTQLPNVAEAIKAAKTLASDKRVWAVVGPAGSQEVQDSFASYKAGGLAFISGSATRTSLTDGTRKGYFFRTVPNDGVQGPTVGKYIVNTLKAKKVYIIDDQETYSQGLADTVQSYLNNHGVSTSRDSISQTASDFSSQIAKIGSDVQIVYIPWQLSAQAQAFGQQMKGAGKSAKLFGSDGLFDPSTFKITGSYDSFFPVNTASKSVTTFAKAHSGDGEFFGAPSAAAAGVAMLAVQKACADGKITRAEVRKDVAATTIPKTTSILGLTVHFTANGDLKGGSFGVYQIQSNGSYKRIG
jgi:branched-chain amino acid transport system substrate-binding protein